MSMILRRTVRGTLFRTNVIEVRESLCILDQNDIKKVILNPDKNLEKMDFTFEVRLINCALNLIFQLGLILQLINKISKLTGLNIYCENAVSGILIVLSLRCAFNDNKVRLSTVTCEKSVFEIRGIFEMKFSKIKSLKVAY